MSDPTQNEHQTDTLAAMRDELAGVRAELVTVKAELVTERDRADRGWAAAQSLDARCAEREIKTAAANADRDAAIRRAELSDERVSGLLADAQEGAEWKKRALIAEPKLQEVTAKAAELELDLVNHAFADGRRRGVLRLQRNDAGELVDSPREVRLRKIFRSDGLAAMRAELEELDRIMPPLGKRVLSDEDPNPRAAVGPIPREILDDTAAQLGLAPDELAEHAEAMTGGINGGRS